MGTSFLILILLLILLLVCFVIDVLIRSEDVKLNADQDAWIFDESNCQKNMPSSIKNQRHSLPMDQTKTALIYIWARFSSLILSDILSMLKICQKISSLSLNNPRYKHIISKTVPMTFSKSKHFLFFFFNNDLIMKNIGSFLWNCRYL